MNRFLPILGMISLLVLGGCTAARNIGSISLDEWNSLSDCSTRSDNAGVMGSPDSVISLEGAGSIELHEFRMRSPDARAAVLSVFGLGILDVSDAIVNKEGSPNYKTCTGHHEADLECAYAKGVMFTHYAGDGRDEKPFCRGLKVIQVGAFDGFSEFTTCPPHYRKLLTGDIYAKGFPNKYRSPESAPLIFNMFRTTTLLDWQRGLKKIRDKRCK